MAEPRNGRQYMNEFNRIIILFEWTPLRLSLAEFLGEKWKITKYLPSQK